MQLPVCLSALNLENYDSYHKFRASVAAAFSLPEISFVVQKNAT